MDQEKKSEMLRLVSSGEINKVLDTLLKDNLPDAQKNIIISLSAQRNRIETDKIKGVLTFEQQNTLENRLVDEVILAIDRIHKGILPPRNPQLQEINFLIEQNFDSFGDRQKIQFVEAIMQLLKLNANVIIKSTERGSIVITLLLPKGSAKELLRLFKKGAFKGTSVTKVYKPKMFKENQLKIWKWKIIFGIFSFLLLIVLYYFLLELGIFS